MKLYSSWRRDNRFESFLRRGSIRFDSIFVGRSWSRLSNCRQDSIDRTRTVPQVKREWALLFDHNCSSIYCYYIWYVIWASVRTSAEFHRVSLNLPSTSYRWKVTMELNVAAKRNISKDISYSTFQNPRKRKLKPFGDFTNNPQFHKCPQSSVRAFLQPSSEWYNRIHQFSSVWVGKTKRVATYCSMMIDRG